METLAQKFDDIADSRFNIGMPFNWNMLYKAMKEHAIEFAKEIKKQGYSEYDETDKWISIEQSNTVYTTKQLYDKFEKENRDK